ncbi:MAG: glucodextranase DOMON-like domain-containing protein [Myxococcota bacterium]
MRRLLAAVALCLWTPAAWATELVFEDPAGDDFGPGGIVYPTDPVYIPGSFDLRKLELRDVGDAVEFRVEFEGAVQDPWDSKAWGGNGFSLQMVQIYLDTTPEKGFAEALPGIHAGFAAADAWDRVVLITPQGPPRLRVVVDERAGAMKSAVVVPRKVSVDAHGIVALVDRKALGGAVSARWGVQAVVASAEPFPEPGNLIARRVNETAGLHRFGGGLDGDCDPNLLDVLALDARGVPAEVEAQKAALTYECGAGDSLTRAAKLPMIRREAKPPGDKAPAASKPAAAKSPPAKPAKAPAAPLPRPKPAAQPE